MQPPIAARRGVRDTMVRVLLATMLTPKMASAEDGSLTETLTYQERLELLINAPAEGMKEDTIAYIAMGTMLGISLAIFILVMAKIGPFRTRVARVSAVQRTPMHFNTAMDVAEVAEHEMTLVKNQLDLSRLTADARLKVKLKRLRSKLKHGTIKSESKPHTSASQRPSVLALELELFQATDQAQVEVSMLESKVDAKTKLFQKKKAARDRKESQESHRLQGKPGGREGQLASSSQTLIHVPPLQGCTRQGLALVEEGVEAAEEQ